MSVRLNTRVSRAMFVAAALAGTGLVAASAKANFIGINFSSSATSRTVTPGSTIGPLALSSNNWNNAPAATGTSSSLIDSNGSAVTGASVTWSAYNTGGNSTLQGYWTSPSTGDDSLWANVLQNGGSTTTPGKITVDLSGIPYASYNLYVYNQGGGQGVAVGVNDSATASTIYYVTDNNGGNPTTLKGWTQATATTSTAAVRANYEVFAETSSTDKITLTSAAANASIAGVEIVETTATPEPTTAALLSVGALMLLRRRKRSAAVA